MAATWIKSLHVNRGKTIAQTLHLRLDYGKNPDKTDGGDLVTGYACDPVLVDEQFLLAKRQYLHITGRDQRDKNVLAYHIRQSFKPGEVDPETANAVGYELAMGFTRGKFPFIVCTHIDRRHVHNHIIFNSTSIDCQSKFRDFLGSGRAVRRISDRICLEHGLSIIENPRLRSKGKFQHYGQWLGDEKPTSYREKLRQEIDAALKKGPQDFDEFLRLMEDAGYEIKRGKHIAFLGPGQKQPTRLRSLGDDYSETAIRERIAGVRTVSGGGGAPERTGPTMNLIIDIQAKILEGKGPGYEQWARIFNLKQMAKTLNFLQEQGLTEYAVLDQRTAEATARFNELSGQIKEKEKRMKEISDLQKHISNYSRTREVYRQYRAAGYSKKFRSQHEGEILLHQSAKRAFDDLGLKKLPSISGLKQEYATALAEKKKLYSSYREARENMQNLTTAKANADRLLHVTEDGKSHQRGR